MNLKVWKRKRVESVSVVECPSTKAEAILHAYGGRTIGHYYNPNKKVNGKLIVINDSRLVEALEVMRKLKQSGVEFDEDTPV